MGRERWTDRLARRWAERRRGAEHEPVQPRAETEPPPPRSEPTAAPISPEIRAEAEQWAAEQTEFLAAEYARIMAAQQEAMRAIEAEIAADKAAEAEAEANQPPILSRSDYVPKEADGRYLTRDADGLPTLRLVDAGDRLAIWSPLDGGALINPKGPGLRRFGLVATAARGADHHGTAFRAADLRPGRWVELRREPDNPHDRNAVALYAPGGRAPFGYVQRGRAPAVARRIDAGEHLAAVSMRGPGPGADDGVVLLLAGSTADLRHMLG